LGNQGGLFAVSSAGAIGSFAGNDSGTFHDQGGNAFAATETGTWHDAFYQAGGYGNGSFSLTCVSYNAGGSGTVAFSGSDSVTDQGTVAAGDSTTASGSAYAQAGGDAATGSRSSGDTTTLAGSATDSASDAYNGSALASWSVSEVGSYGNFSFAFASWVYRSNDTVNDTVVGAAADTLSGTVTDTGQGAEVLGHTGAIGYASKGLSGTLLGHGSLAFTDAGWVQSGATVNAGATSSLYEAGAYAFGSFSLTCVAYRASGSDTVAAQSADSATDCLGDTTVSGDTFGNGGTLAYPGTNFAATDTATANGTVAGGDTTSAGDSSTGSSTGSWSVVELGSYSGFSFALSCVVYQAGGSSQGTVQDNGAASFGSAGTAAGLGTAQGSSAGSMGFVAPQHSSQDSATASLTQTLGYGYRATATFNDTGAGSYSLYEAGSYSGYCFAFASVSYQAYGNDSLSASDTTSASDSTVQSGGATFGEQRNDSGSAGSTSATDSATQSVTDANAWNNGDGAQDTVSGQGGDGFRLIEQGSYGAGSFALGCYVFSAQGSYAYQGLGTTTGYNGGNVTASAGDGSAATATGWFGGGPQGCASYLTVSALASNTFHGGDAATLGLSDTVMANYSGSYSEVLYQAGIFAGGSFSLGSVGYSLVYNDGVRRQDLGTWASSDSSTDGTTDAGVESSSDPLDTGYGHASLSYGNVDTLTSQDTTTEYRTDLYALYEGGSYGAGSYALTSYALLEQVTDTGAATYHTTDGSGASGSSYVYDVQDGVVVENASGAFSWGTTSNATYVWG
jgi:hypothetical protein